MFRFGWAVAIAMTLCAGTAHAQSADAQAADTRCAMLGLAMAGGQNASPEQRQAGTIMALYYVGRLHGRAPNFDLRAAIQQQAQTLSQELAQAEGQRCGLEFRAVGQALNAVATPAPAPAPTP